MDAFLTWLEHSPMSVAVTHSNYTLGFVSAMHVIGFTCVMGSMLVANLRMAGLIFADRPLDEIVSPASRVIAAGVLINAISGFLMFSARAHTAVENDYFRLKMLVLVGAVLTQFVIRPIVVRGAAAPGSTSGATRATGVAGLALWSGVMLSAFAFLLLE